MTWRAYAHAPSEPPPFALMLVAPTSGQAAPEGQMTWAVHFSLPPTLFEPAETAGVVSPFMPRAARAGHARASPRRTGRRRAGKGSRERSWPQREPGGAPDFLADLAGEAVGSVHVAALEHDQPGAHIRDGLEDEALHGGRLAQVAIRGLEHQHHARRERHEATRLRPRRDPSFRPPFRPEAAPRAAGTFRLTGGRGRTPGCDRARARATAPAASPARALTAEASRAGSTRSRRRGRDRHRG